MTDMSEAKTKVFAALYRAAKTDAPCPSNVDLARVIGCSSSAVASRTVTLLEADGRIAVHRTRNFRLVSIPGTDFRTARQPAPFSNPPTRTDEMAEHMAEGATVEQAALAMCVTDDHAWKIWRIIVAGLGRQSA